MLINWWVKFKHCKCSINFLNKDQLEEIEARLTETPEVRREALEYIVDTRKKIPTIRDLKKDQLVCIVFNSDETFLGE